MALCLQVLCVALDGTQGFVPYRKTDGRSLSPIMALCLQISRVALDDTLGVELLVKIQREKKKGIIPYRCSK
jgi:hypothetical protein